MHAGNLRGWRGRETSVLADAREGGIFVGSDEGDVIEFEMEVLDRLLNEVAVTIADVTKLWSGNADKWA
jgi:hypothetical protein